MVKMPGETLVMEAIDLDFTPALRPEIVQFEDACRRLTRLLCSKGLGDDITLDDALASLSAAESVIGMCCQIAHYRTRRSCEKNREKGHQ
jgi:hypothetical protein